MVTAHEDPEADTTLSELPQGGLVSVAPPTALEEKDSSTFLKNLQTLCSLPVASLAVLPIMDPISLLQCQSPLH